MADGETGARTGRASEAFAFHPLARQLARTANRFRLLPRLALGGLLVAAAELHFAEQPFTLHLFLQRLEGLIDIVVANDDLDDGSYSSVGRALATRQCRAKFTEKQRRRETCPAPLDLVLLAWVRPDVKALIGASTAA